MEVIEYCIGHGYQKFFLGYDDEDNESLHCPKCFENHSDNPLVIRANEEIQENFCNSIMAL